MDIYDMLFADQELEVVLLELKLEPGSAIARARALLWEGRFEEAASTGAGTGGTVVELARGCGTDPGRSRCATHAARPRGGPWRGVADPLVGMDRAARTRRAPIGDARR